MTKNFLAKIKSVQIGLSLIEVLVALIILALILPSIGMIVYQIYSVTTSSNDRIIAIRQVQNVGQWVSKDVQMVNSGILTNGTNPILTLEWNNTLYEPGNHHFVKYNLSPNNQLTRQYCDAAGNPVGDAIIAQYISSFSFNVATGTLVITATVGNAIETREYQILKRPE